MTTTITIKDPTAPASQAQLGYLDSLVTQRDLPTVCERYALLKGLNAVNKGQASEWINQLLAAPKKTANTGTFVVNNPPLQQTPAKAYQASAEQIASQYPVDTVAAVAPKFGYYEIDGVFYNWEKQTKDYSPQLRKLILPTTTYWGTKTNAKWGKVYTAYGKSTKIDGVYVPNMLLEAVAAGAKPLTVEQAAAKGKALSFCVKCGKQLTDPVSVAQGIGPVCIKTGMWA